MYEQTNPGRCDAADNYRHNAVCCKINAESHAKIEFIFLKCIEDEPYRDVTNFYRIPLEGQNIKYEDYFGVWNADQREWRRVERLKPLAFYKYSYKVSVTKNIVSLDINMYMDSFGRVEDNYKNYKLEINRRTGGFSEAFFNKKK